MYTAQAVHLYLGLECYSRIGIFPFKWTSHCNMAQQEVDTPDAVSFHHPGPPRRPRRPLTEIVGLRRVPWSGEFRPQDGTSVLLGLTQGSGVTLTEAALMVQQTCRGWGRDSGTTGLR